jgi:membrane-bound lytic murein transglycosylase MltF
MHPEFSASREALDPQLAPHLSSGRHMMRFKLWRFQVFRRWRTRQIGVFWAGLLVVTTAGLTARGDGTSQAEQDTLGGHVGARYIADLDQVLERRFLRVLTSTNSFDYFIYQGHHAGYQYEMVREFTKFLNQKHRRGRGKLKVQFELLPVSSEQLIPQLIEGRADLIASRMTITPERARRVLFSNPYRAIDELVVSNQSLTDSKFIHDLSGRSVAVRKSSSYHESLVVESKRLVAVGKQRIRIVIVDEALATEDILALVAAGHFDFTVADSIVAETAVEILPELRILPGLTVRKGGQLAWATHLTSPALQAEMNEFLKRYRHGSLLGNVAVKKYFEDHTGLQTRLASGDDIVLSAYDDTLRKVAGEFDLDWRLMAAVAYQESRFDQSSRNRSGATGLFQIKPKTAREPYIDSPEIAGEKNASNNIRAGIKYVAWIKHRYFDPVETMRERDRMRMALAAYNAGPRTLINARRRAEQMELDPNRWFRNVEMALLAMRKPEPVKYVSEINQRYLSYLMLGVE